MASMDFFFSIGSTYSYLTVSRLPEVAKLAGVDVTWRPFDVRTIMIEQNNIPFRDKPIKTAYMWRDIERKSELYGLNPSLPAPYPLPELVLANRVACLGMQEGWGVNYVRTAYALWFEEGVRPGEEPSLTRCLDMAGADVGQVLAAAQNQGAQDLLDAETDAARAAGLFGAPSFVVKGEVFWGDDRLEDALDWALRAS